MSEEKGRMVKGGAVFPCLLLLNFEDLKSKLECLQCSS